MNESESATARRTPAPGKKKESRGAVFSRTLSRFYRRHRTTLACMCVSRAVLECAKGGARQMPALRAAAPWTRVRSVRPERVDPCARIQKFAHVFRGREGNAFDGFLGVVSTERRSRERKGGISPRYRFRSAKVNYFRGPPSRSAGGKDFKSRLATGATPGSL